MSTKTEAELKEAESIMAQILSFRQYGAPAGSSPKNIQNLLDRTVEHFLRRDEPESIYFGRFDEKPDPDQLDLRDLYGTCVCGQWSENPREVHMISAPCYYITED